MPLVVAAALGAQIPRLQVDTSTEGFLHPSDPTLATYDAFRERFGRDDFILVGVATDDAFALPFLERLRDLHERIERDVPHVDEVTSLVNARWSRGEDGQLVVEEFMARWPTSAAEANELRRLALGNPLYIDNLVTADATLATLLIDLDVFVQDGIDAEGAPALRHLTGGEYRQAVDGLERAIAASSTPGFEPRAAGIPLMADRLAYRLMDDFPNLVRRALVVMALLLYALLGTVRAVVLPLIVVVLSLISTIGLMPLLGMDYQIPTQVVPVSLLAIGVGDSVHVLAIYYQRRRAGEPREQALPAAYAHAAPAIVMTTLTTAGALLSFLSAELAPVANIGILLPAGVVIAFLMTMSALPAMLTVLPERRIPRRRGLIRVERAVVGLGTASARHPWPVLAGAGVVVVISLAGVTRLGFSHDPIGWFPEADPFRRSTLALNEALGGVVAMEVLFDTGEIDGAKDPDLLAVVEELAASNASRRSDQLRVAKTISVTDMLKEIHRALNENDPAHYALPGERELVAQELLLFELSGNDDLEDFVDYEYTTARMTLRLPWADALGYGPFMDALALDYRQRTGDHADVVVTGRVALLARTISAMITSMARSYVLAIIAVTPLMMLLLGSVRLGALSMVPNVLPILAALGLMGWTRIPLDSFSLLTGSIALGLAVDDTIHFMHGFRRAYSGCGDVVEAVRSTLATTGQALLFTTLILCAGFLLYVTGYMLNARSFGIITAFALAVALLADICLAPALVALTAGADSTRSGADDRPRP